MLPGRVVAAFNGAFVGIAALAFEKQFKVLTPAKPAHRFRVSSQSVSLL
jgi:hypothetical protein